MVRSARGGARQPAPEAHCWQRCRAEHTYVGDRLTGVLVVQPVELSPQVQHLVRVDLDVAGLALHVRGGRSARLPPCRAPGRRPWVGRTWKPPEGWCIMMRACGSDRLSPCSPAHSNREAMDAACPMHSVPTGLWMYCARGAELRRGGAQGPRLAPPGRRPRTSPAWCHRWPGRRRRTRRES